MKRREFHLPVLSANTRAVDGVVVKVEVPPHHHRVRHTTGLSNEITHARHDLLVRDGAREVKVQHLHQYYSIS